MSKSRSIMELAHDALTIASWTRLSEIVGMPVSEEELILLNEWSGGNCTHLHGIKLCVSLQDLHGELVKHNLRMGDE